MSRTISTSRSFSNRSAVSVVALIVFLSMWSNTAAAMLCPHMNGRGDCRPAQKAQSHCHEMRGVKHPMDMSGADTERVEPDSQSMTVTNVRSEIPTGVNNEALSRPGETCSHCMMHSQSQSPLFSRAVQDGSSSDSFTPDSVSDSVELMPASSLLFDVHDNSPPGIPSPRYVLLSVFRI